MLELKCLEQNLFSSVYAEKLAVLVRKWIGQGFIPRSGDVTINLQTVPEPCQREWLELLKRPIKRVLEKANSQIKATKRVLNLPSAKGVLLIANEGILLPPQELMNLVHRILSSRKPDKTSPIFSSIDWVVLFSVNRPMMFTPEQRESHYWMSIPRDGDCDSAMRDFLGAFRNGWFTHFGNLVGLPVERKRLGRQDLDAISVT